MKRIEIVIDHKGAIQIQTTGFTGSSCQEASRILEQALGLAQTDVRTAEFYEPARNQTEQQQRS